MEGVKPIMTFKVVDGPATIEELLGLDEAEVETRIKRMRENIPTYHKRSTEAEVCFFASKEQKFLSDEETEWRALYAYAELNPSHFHKEIGKREESERERILEGLQELYVIKRYLARNPKEYNEVLEREQWP